jgi:hypothetical protein
MADLLKQVDPDKKLPEFRTLRCPMVGHQASWCRFLCKPIQGRGLCGRRAPHGLKSRWREAIRRYNRVAEECRAVCGH